MRIVGSIVFTEEDAKSLSGRSSLMLPPLAWSDHARRRVRAGDLFWVREPFVEYEDKRCPWQNDIAYGNPATAVRPEWFKKHSPDKVRYYPAVKMARAQSRYTLEVIAITDERSLHCWIHHEQISRHVAKAAA